MDSSLDELGTGELHAVDEGRRAVQVTYGVNNITGRAAQSLVDQTG